MLLVIMLGYAQNVGIGMPAPAEELNVARNINITDTIKANGLIGTTVHELMKNNLTLFLNSTSLYKKITP